jgi:shikimate kinase
MRADDGYWILVGMMGSGKSTIGRELAQATGRPFVDTDRLLQHRLGRNLPDLFRVYGEEAFRDHETAALRSLAREPGVLSTGGGMVLREANWREMRRLGATIYLQSSYEALRARLERSQRRRPLLRLDDWPDRLRSILEARTPLYERADLTVPVDGQPVEICVAAILRALEAEP